MGLPFDVSYMKSILSACLAPKSRNANDSITLLFLVMAIIATASVAYAALDQFTGGSWPPPNLSVLNGLGRASKNTFVLYDTWESCREACIIFRCKLYTGITLDGITLI